MSNLSKFFLLHLTLLLAAPWLSAQTITMTFTGKSIESDHIPLDSIKIFDYQHNWEETILFPDTTLVLTQNIGITSYEYPDNSSALTIYPNPTNGETTAQWWQEKDGMVTVSMTDLTGKVLDSWSGWLEQGVHSFNVLLSSTHIAVITVQTAHSTISQKIVNMGNAGRNAIQHIGIQPKVNQPRWVSYHPFALNDLMYFTGYCTVGGIVYEKEIILMAQSDSMITFRFHVITSYGKKPCPKAQNVMDYDGNVYPTIQIGSQCWTQKNMRTTHYSNGDAIPFSITTSSDSAYRHYPGLDSVNVDFYGYLYNWQAAVHCDTLANQVHYWGNDSVNDILIQGICPDGWHLPSYYEYQELIQYLSQYDIYYCGDDSMNVSKSLASRYYYYVQNCDTCLITCEPEFNNASGFTGLLAGRYVGPTCSFFGGQGYYWTSTQTGSGWACALGLSTSFPHVTPSQPLGTQKSEGHAIRCILNE